MSAALRSRAELLFRAACAAADPAQALRSALRQHPVPDLGAAGRYIVVAVGKAATAMAEAMLDVLGPAPVQALVVTNHQNRRPLPGARIMVAGHPVPDQDGTAAARAVIALLGGARAEDRVIALISGGGSAMLPAPVGELTLADEIAVGRLLLERGFDIRAANLVRQQLSRLKGGGMLQFAAPAPVTAYILSDVIGDDLSVVASGPTVAPIGSSEEARSLIEARGLWLLLPEEVRAHLARGKATTSAAALPEARNHLIGSNRKSLEAVATAAADLNPAILCAALVGPVAEAAARIVAAAQDAPPGRPACLIFGGETVVNITRSARGALPCMGGGATGRASAERAAPAGALDPCSATRCSGLGASLRAASLPQRSLRRGGARRATTSR